MKLKCGTVYIFKTTWGEIHEAEFLACIKSANVFRPLPFMAVGAPPRSVSDEEIEWAEPICPMTRSLTENEYHNFIADTFK